MYFFILIKLSFLFFIFLISNDFLKFLPIILPLLLSVAFFTVWKEKF